VVSTVDLGTLMVVALLGSPGDRLGRGIEAQIGREVLGCMTRRLLETDDEMGTRSAEPQRKELLLACRPRLAVCSSINYCEAARIIQGPRVASTRSGLVKGKVAQRRKASQKSLGTRLLRFFARVRPGSPVPEGRS
jgi:hypothetical protein